MVRQVLHVTSDTSTPSVVLSHTRRSSALMPFATSQLRILSPWRISKCPAEFIYSRSFPYRCIHCLAIPSVIRTGGLAASKALQSLYEVECVLANARTASPYFSSSSAALDTVVVSGGAACFTSHTFSTPSDTWIAGLRCCKALCSVRAVTYSAYCARTSSP